MEIKTNPDGAALTLRTIVSEPFIPASAVAMRGAFALTADTATWVTAEEAKSLASVPAGTPFTVPPVLFAKITEKDLEFYRGRFGGSDA